ncbi:hypothetical protein [Halorubrum sp. F4]|uniref:hypothetical protein n=1 Tax=Halorubrum sp. F4 TaxID=2989715 RepID=UPI00247FDFD7|nr:hypothetical protein [Halorubrum sp. F4]
MDVDNTGVVAFAVVVALLLVGLPFYAGTFSPGYSPNSYNYEHEIEAGPADDVTGGLELGDDTDLEDITYEYEEMSPTARELFDRTLRADSSEYVPDVCENYVLVCDGYYKQDLPSEFIYGPGMSDEFRYSVVEYDGNGYLLRTGVEEGSGPNFLLGFVVFFVRGLMLLHGGAIAAATAVRLSDRWTGLGSRGYTALVGGGALLVALGVLTPYLEMYVGISPVTIVVASGTATVIGYVYGSVVWLFRR